MNREVTKTLLLESTATAKGFSAVVTSEVVDRDGDVIIAQGGNLVNYEKNPVLLAFHEDKNPPVGKCVKVRRLPTTIEMDFAMDPRPSNYIGEWLPDRLGGAVAAGSMRGVSIRFGALPGGVRRANTADIAKYGPDCLQVYSKWEMLEVSLVSIPANQEALIYAVQKAARKTPPAQPSRHSIHVRVPLIGENDISRIAREEIAKACGRLWY